MVPALGPARGRTCCSAGLSGIDAVFCGNDQIATGVTQTLRDLGRAIPDDVAIVGYDNWTEFAADCRPPLTTVDLNLEQLGSTAVDAPVRGPGRAAVPPACFACCAGWSSARSTVVRPPP